MITSAIHATHLISNDRAIQATSYYPYGLPWAETTSPSHSLRKYSSKEFYTQSGYDTYNFEARQYHPAVPRFTTPDPLAEKFYDTGVYTYCSGNPIRNIDPTGEDIVVLNYSDGEHLAMLIQNKEGKWQYYSINGDNVINPITKNHTGGRPFNDVGVGSWDSPEEFLNSSYNVSHGDEGKTDDSINNYDFTEGYQISTTSDQDESMRNEFSKIAKSKYNLFTNNCATAVQEVMIDAGIPVSEPTMVPYTEPMSTPFGIVEIFGGYQMKCNINIIPSSAFKSIIKWNPDGKYIQKQSIW